MTLRTYTTNRWLWCALSLVAFVVVGLAVQFRVVKVGDVSLASRLFQVASDLLAGREEFASIRAVGLVLAIWIVVAVMLGWFLQSIVVIAVSWIRERSKPSA